MRRAIAVCTALLVGAVGCGGDSENGDRLRVGVLGPLSGTAAPFGIALENGARLYADEHRGENALEIDGSMYEVEPIVYDTEGDVGETAVVTERLAFEDEVNYIVGNAVGATCEAAQTVTEAEGIFFSFVCFGRTNLGEDKPLSFRVLPGPDEVAPLMYDWITENRPEVDRVALIAPADQSGVDTSAAIEDAAGERDIEVVANEEYERGTQEFTPILTRIVGEQPDMIDLSGSAPGDGALILRQLDSLGYEGELAWTALLDPAPVIEAAGQEVVEGLLSIIGWDLTSEESPQPLRDFARRYQERFDEPATLIAAAQYATFEILVQSMQEAGTMDPTEVVEQIAQQGTFEDTVLGTVTITGEETYGINRQFIYPLVVSETVGGRQTPIERVEP